MSLRKSRKCPHVVVEWEHIPVEDAEARVLQAFELLLSKPNDVDSPFDKRPRANQDVATSDPS